MHFKRKRKKMLQSISMVLITFLIMQIIFMPAVFAGDTLPYTGESATGKNQPIQHGYTANQILEWDPARDKYADMLRARVPLQERNEPFTATQANPNLNPDTQMFNLAGDYGNAFLDSTAYTNKFGQYTFPYWQYIDYYSYWHGMATADVPPELYDPNAEWTQRWFEFGVLNIPNPAYTNAAHKNGVKSLGVIFFSNNDRGPQTYTQMFIRDEEGNLPVAEKLIEIADYFGFDGYFFNQEEITGVRPEHIPVYKEFLKVLRDSGLYVQWYDSVHNETGRNVFQNEFNELNSPFLIDSEYGELAHSIFLNYNWNRQRMENSREHAESLGLNPYEAVFAGVEAGADRFGRHRNDLRNNLDANGQPMNSIAMLGSDFTHHGLDEDLPGDDTNRRSNSDYQWMSFIRDRAWWSGPHQDPTNPGRDSTVDLNDVGAQGDHWDGVAAYIAERSVIQGSNFVSNFNLGRGLEFYVDGELNNEEEWSNINIQDIPVTWQWWIDTEGTKLQVDFDFGPRYNSGDRFNYEQIGAFNGGSSIVVNGDLDAENFLRLYKTDLDVLATSEFSLTYQKVSNDDASKMHVGLIFTDEPEKVEKITIPNSGLKTDGWETVDLDLSQYAGRQIAAFGIIFDNGDEGVISDYQVNIGQVKLTDGTLEKPDQPTGLEITKALKDTNEMYISWDIDDYETVKQYHIYNNGVFVGGIYDEVFYIKNLQDLSGEISLTAVGADGQESEPMTVSYDLEAGVSQIEVSEDGNGEMTVRWENPSSVNGDITIHIETEYDDTEHVDETVTVDSGTTSVTLSDMPINGDKYLLRIKIGDHDWVSYRGTFIDRYIEPYGPENVTIEGNEVTWELPKARDWHKLYVYENGERRYFNTTYSQGYRDHIIRGRTQLTELTFTKDDIDSILEFEIVDYAGNRARTLIDPEIIVTADDNALTRTETTQIKIRQIRAKDGQDEDLDFDIFDVSFESENPSIASVDETGTVTAHKTGHTDISVSLTVYDGYTYVFKVPIEVEERHMEAGAGFSVAIHPSIVEVNESATVTITADQVANLAGFDIQLEYDKDMLTLNEIVVNDSFNFTDDLRSDGRVDVLGVLLGATDGLSGDVELVRLNFMTKDRDGLSSIKLLEGSQLSDIDAALYTQENTLEVDFPIANSDITGGGTAINDLVLVAQAFDIDGSRDVYDESLDMNKDGVIDIIDIAYVAKRVLNR